MVKSASQHDDGDEVIRVNLRISRHDTPELYQAIKDQVTPKYRAERIRTLAAMGYCLDQTCAIAEQVVRRHVPAQETGGVTSSIPDEQVKSGSTDDNEALDPIDESRVDNSVLDNLDGKLFS